MPLQYLIVPFFCMIPVGVYLFFYMRRAARFWGLNTRRPYVYLPLALAALALVVLSANIFYLPAMLVLHVAAAALLCDIVNAAVALVRRAAHRPRSGFSLWDRAYRCGLIPLVVTALIIGYGYINMTTVIETDYTVTTAKPAAHGLRIVYISDLHTGTTMNTEKLSSYCDRMSDAGADIVALGGDIFDESTMLREMRDAARLLGGIENRLGIFYVFGNHDKATYSSSAEIDEHSIRAALAENGITVLEDETVSPAPGISVIGRRDVAYSAAGRRDIASLMSEADSGDFVLLLDHRPSELEALAAAGVDLALAGHTHAGQMWPTGQLRELVGSSEMNYGIRRVGSADIIVSSGIAGWGYPIRTGAHSEYVVIDIARG